MRRARNSVAFAVAGAVVLVAVLAIGLAAILGAFNSLGAHAAVLRVPQNVPRLPTVPAVQRKGPVCTGQQWEPRVVSAGTGAVTVDPHPTGATVFWVPGLNSRSCRVRVSELTAASANSLAQVIRSSEPMSGDGMTNCPEDDGSGAWFFFRYAGRSNLEVVHVNLTGCVVLSAPYRAALRWNSNIAGILQKLEPPGWSEAWPQ